MPTPTPPDRKFELSRKYMGLKLENKDSYPADPERLVSTGIIIQCIEQRYVLEFLTKVKNDEKILYFKRIYRGSCLNKNGVNYSLKLRKIREN